MVQEHYPGDTRSDRKDTGRTIINYYELRTVGKISANPIYEM